MLTLSHLCNLGCLYRTPVVQMNLSEIVFTHKITMEIHIFEEEKWKITPLICRICLIKGKEMLEIFTQTTFDDLELNYASMMMLCASVQIESDDPYPKYICTDCLENMKNAFAFKITCEKSYLKLIGSEDNLETLQDQPQDFLNPQEDLIESTSTDLTIKIYTCEECDQNFKKIDHYTRHLAQHGILNDTKKFKCTLCEKEFKSLHGLKYHIESHKGIKQYKCPYPNCDWSFITKQSLDKHTKTHSDVKTFLCSICGKGYTTKDSLAHHVKTHTGLRPFKCEHCEKSYLQSSHLKKHLLMHLGLKPHTCELCGRSYTTKSQLKKHFMKFCGEGIQPVFRFRKNEKVL